MIKKKLAIHGTKYEERDDTKSGMSWVNY